MRILVTGHKGFIGKNLISSFKETEHKLFGIDLPENNILNCKLPEEIDIVIHLAGLASVRESFRNVQAYWDVNVEGTRRIINAFPTARILVASSSNAAIPHSNPYAMSKNVMEQLPHNNKLNMRFTTVYGPDSRDNMLFGLARDGKLKYTTKHIRDFIHVDDLCKVIHHYIESDKTGTVDVGTGMGTRVCDIFPDLPVKEDTPGEVQNNTARKDFVLDEYKTVWDFWRSAEPVTIFNWKKTDE